MEGANTLFLTTVPRITAIGTCLPGFATLFCVLWSVLFDFKQSTNTHCRVPNYLPSISAAIGGFTPQRYVWRICIALHTAPRILALLMYRGWHKQINVGKHQTVYTNLVNTALTLHGLENACLITLTYISSDENKDLHEWAFIFFIVFSQLYMLLTCIIMKWVRDATGLRKTVQDNRSYRYKKFLFLFNFSCFLVATYLYFRHNRYCEPLVYTWFALCEYLTVFSNIFFHGTLMMDVRDYTPAVVLTQLLNKHK